MLKATALIVPKSVISDTIAFYEREVAMDVLSFCNVIINQKDEESLLRAMKISIDISESTIKKLLSYAAEHDLSLWDSLTRCKLENHEKQDLRVFMRFIDGFKNLVNELDTYEFLKSVILSKFLLFYFAEMDDKSTLILWELLSRANSFTKKGDRNITDFLTTIAVVKETKF